MVIETWTDLVTQLEAALAFARGLGLDDGAVAGSRFTAFRARIVDLAGALERDGNDAAFKRFMSDVEFNAVALTESNELVTVLSYLESIPPQCAKKKLQVALQGPQLPADEDAQSNEARNTMFELNLAARLHRAGLPVDIGGDADLEFACDGVRWFGECKRPYKVDTIESNIGEACRQLGERLSSSRLAARGLLAISLSRPLTTKATYLEYAGEAQLKQALEEHVGFMVELMKKRMLELDQCRAAPGLGLLLAHLIMPAWDTAVGIPTSVQYSAGADVCGNGTGDGERLWTIIGRTFNR